MSTGYIITLVFAGLWIAFIVFENVKKHIDKKRTEKKLASEKKDDYSSLIL